MLMQQSIKEGQKKYYDFAAEFELQDLYRVGVAGVKVKIFSSTMDTKGREELSGTCIWETLHVLRICMSTVSDRRCAQSM